MTQKEFKRWRPTLGERLKTIRHGYPMSWWVLERHLLRREFDLRLAKRWYGLKCTAMGACGVGAAAVAGLFCKLVFHRLSLGPVMMAYAFGSVTGYLLPDLKLHFEIRANRRRLRAALREVLPEILGIIGSDEDVKQTMKRLADRMPSIPGRLCRRFLHLTESPREPLMALGHVTHLSDLYWWAYQRGWRRPEDASDQSV